MFQNIQIRRIYSDENLKKMFEIGSQYSNKFLFLFDHAYLIHDFLPTPEQKPLWQVVEESNVQDQTVVTTSFQKLLCGGGISLWLLQDTH